MGKIKLNVGDTFTFTKTVSESDVYLFAGITGDFHPNHVNEAYMKNSVYGTRIVHGALGIGFISATSSVLQYPVESKDEEKMKTVADVQILNEKGEVCTVAKHIAKYFED